MKLRLAKASQLSWSWGLAWLSLAIMGLGPHRNKLSSKIKCIKTTCLCRSHIQGLHYPDLVAVTVFFMWRSFPSYCLRQNLKTSFVLLKHDKVGPYDSWLASSLGYFESF